MRVVQVTLATLIAMGIAAGAAKAQPEFQLSIDAPATIEAAEGSEISAEAVVRLATEGLAPGSDGVQAWSLSITAEGLGSGPDGGWVIVGGTTSGTVAALVDEESPGLRLSEEDSFLYVELTEGEGNAGLVSAVVLSFQNPITLDPQDSPHALLRVSLAAAAPLHSEGSATYGIAFRDGQVGSARPVDNLVTYRGETFQPSQQGSETLVIPIVDCTESPLAVVFQAAPHGQIVPEPEEDRVEVLYSSAIEVLEAPVIPGGIGSTQVCVGIVSQLEEEGIQGWSLSVAADDLNMIAATTAGTVGQDVSLNTPPGAPCSPGCRNSGFEKTEVIDPTRPENAGQQGAVSAVVLSFTLPIQLELVSTATVLALTVEAPEPVEEDSVVSGMLRLQGDLWGSGQPVKNVATVAGVSLDYCGIDQTRLRVDFVPKQVGAFRSGDGNGDGKIDLADPIYVINYLFRSGEDIPCREAADANADLSVDLSDAAYLVRYLFQSGSPPVGSLECHTSPLSTPESCPQGATACDG
ncbi:MAG: dockerin type I repeat-containing protein [Planctomycetes bacterium]|nr:dockerin type I repeat-containing protein [Planctomycetota bacterium]